MTTGSGRDHEQGHDDPYATTYGRRAFLSRSAFIVAALGATGLAGAAPASANAEQTTEVKRLSLALDENGPVINCACAASDAVISVAGQGEYEAQFKGFLAAHAEKEFEYESTAVLPLTIAAHETVGTASGLGTFRVSHDFERPAPVSFVRENVAGQAYPATQEMFVNILVEIDSLPGIVLRNVETAVLRNQSVLSLPPKNASYTLVKPMALEPVDSPGQVLATIESYTAVVNTDH